MEQKGVIKKVHVPTEWVNSLVIVEKHDSNDIRICLDPRNLNKAIQREHHPLPTIEDITTRLTGAKVFSKLDANSGYWQIPLEEESQLLTTFNTPQGRYCFTRMPFGITSAQEIFHKRINEAFEDLEGVETDIDDILVWGTNTKEHDERLRKVLNRCYAINLTLNEKKCQFNKEEITYLGHKLTQNGVQPDQEKIKAIAAMPPPEDKKGVERLLGTVNYMAKFIPNLSTISEPIRMLLKKEVQFTWEHEQERAFVEIKNALTSEKTLGYFNPNEAITLECDSSQSGLGAVVTQNEKPIAYASRSLREVETRYAQIEKELLAVVFGLERFENLTYGQHVTVLSDHKPLEAILNKPICSSPPRLQRMLIRLHKFNITLKYKEGKHMFISDMLSRAYLKEKTRSDEQIEKDIHLFVNQVESCWNVKE